MERNFTSGSPHFFLYVSTLRRCRALAALRPWPRYVVQLQGNTGITDALVPGLSVHVRSMQRQGQTGLHIVGVSELCSGVFTILFSR